MALDLGPLGWFGPLLITAGSVVMVAIFIARVATAGLAVRRDDDHRRAGLDVRQRAVARRRADLSRRLLVAGVPGADDRGRAARAEPRPAADARRPRRVRRRRRDRCWPASVAARWWPEPGVRADRRGAHRVDVVAGALRRRAAHRASARADAVHGGEPARRLCVAGYRRRDRGGHRQRPCQAWSTTRCSTPSSSGSCCRWCSRMRRLFFRPSSACRSPIARSFYLHVGVLHLSLILRVVGDLVESSDAGEAGAACSMRSRC